jgi:hypothetical protein
MERKPPLKTKLDDFLSSVLPPRTPEDIAWLERHVWIYPFKVWFLAGCLRAGAVLCSASMFVLVLSAAPDISRYLYSVVTIQFFDDFLPPLVIVELLALCGIVTMYAWRASSVEYVARVFMADKTPQPYEDTEMPI